MRNEEWESWTREYGWPVQGCWSGNQEVLACDRSLKEIKSSRLLAAGYDNGSIRVFKYLYYYNFYRYPCILEDQKYLESKCHGQKISNIKFSTNSNVLVSTSSDGCVFKWKII